MLPYTNCKLFSKHDKTKHRPLPARPPHAAFQNIDSMWTNLYVCIKNFIEKINYGLFTITSNIFKV